MPELPEVETVRRGLEPFLQGARISGVTLNRPNLRFDFPPQFAERIVGAKITNVGRRAKYLLLTLSNGITLLSHLGMTGNFRFAHPDAQNRFAKHDHVVFQIENLHHENPDAPTPYLVYSDPRRFGFMDLFESAHDSKYLVGLGPEPLGNGFQADYLALRIAKRKAPIKNLLLDQKIVAGLGNIYVCEALFEASIDPHTSGERLVTKLGAPRAKLIKLTAAVRDILRAAIQAGGSTLQDYKKVDGETGYFQHNFHVYGREGEPCSRDGCEGIIKRVPQAGRSSFFCPQCQTGNGQPYGG